MPQRRSDPPTTPVGTHQHWHLAWRPLTAVPVEHELGSSHSLWTACYPRGGDLGGCVGSRTLTTITCGRPRCPHGQGVGVGAEAAVPVVPGAYPIVSERGVRAVRGCREGQEGLL
eukprot:6212534-Pleurochrysis_carterae.AAC.1